MNLTDITLSKGLLSFLCNLIKRPNDESTCGMEIRMWLRVGKVTGKTWGNYPERRNVQYLVWGGAFKDGDNRPNSSSWTPMIIALRCELITSPLKKKQQQKTIGQLESPSLGWQMRSSYTATSASAPMTDIIHGFQHSAPLILSGASAYTTM